MPKIKKPELEKIQRDLRANPGAVEHGCISCEYMSVEVSKFPCSECDAKGGKWYYWTKKKKKGALQL